MEEARAPSAGGRRLQSTPQGAGRGPRILGGAWGLGGCGLPGSPRALRAHGLGPGGLGSRPTPCAPLSKVNTWERRWPDRCNPARPTAAVRCLPRCCRPRASHGRGGVCLAVERRWQPRPAQLHHPVVSRRRPGRSERGPGAGEGKGRSRRGFLGTPGASRVRGWAPGPAPSDVRPPARRLVDNFCIREGYSTPRCLMYEIYMESCGQNAENQVNLATFGK
ncbi:DNA-binding protein RFX8 [Callithrix jacchus]